MLNSSKNHDSQSKSQATKGGEQPAWWGEETKLTPEQIIIWLDLHRQFMFEVWSNNPELRRKWEEINNC